MHRSLGETCREGCAGEVLARVRGVVAGLMVEAPLVHHAFDLGRRAGNVDVMQNVEKEGVVEEGVLVLHGLDRHYLQRHTLDLQVAQAVSGDLDDLG